MKNYLLIAITFLLFFVAACGTDQTELATPVQSIEKPLEFSQPIKASWLEVSLEQPGLAKISQVGSDQLHTLEIIKETQNGDAFTKVFFDNRRACTLTHWADGSGAAGSQNDSDFDCRFNGTVTIKGDWRISNTDIVTKQLYGMSIPVTMKTTDFIVSVESEGAEIFVVWVQKITETPKDLTFQAYINGTYTCQFTFNKTGGTTYTANNDHCVSLALTPAGQVLGVQVISEYPLFISEVNE